MDVGGVLWQGPAAAAAAKLLHDFLGPPTRELGKTVADRIGEFRAMRLLEVAKRWDDKRRALGLVGVPPPPFIRDLLQDGTWDSDSGIQELWASLLANVSTSESGKFASISFTGVLKRLEPEDAAFLKRQFTRWGLPLPSNRRVDARDFEAYFDGERVTVRPELTNLEAVGLVRWVEPPPDPVEAVARAAKGLRRHGGRVGGGLSDLEALRPSLGSKEWPGACLTRYGVRFLLVCSDPLDDPLEPPEEVGTEGKVWEGPLWEWSRHCFALALDCPHGSSARRILSTAADEAHSRLEQPNEPGGGDRRSSE